LNEVDDAYKPGMQVEVEANPSYDEQCDSIEDQDMWSLTFVVKVPAARMTHTFIVHEPYLVTLSSWQGIAAGTTKYLALYLGNGDGGISIETHDGMKMISFVGAPSGAGGDVESIFEVPLEECRRATQRSTPGSHPVQIPLRGGGASGSTMRRTMFARRCIFWGKCLHKCILAHEEESY
jgi:hypothetical protein